MRPPGFLIELQRQLESLDLSILDAVNRTGGLEVSQLLDLLTKPVDHTVYEPQVPDFSRCIHVVDDEDTDSFWKGKESLTSGKTLLVLVVSPELQSNLSSIETHLIQTSWVKNTLLLVDPSSKDCVQELVFKLGRGNVRIIENYVTFLLTPDNRLDDRDSACHLGSCGAGDLINLLRGIDLECEHVAVVDPKESTRLNLSLVGRHISGTKLVTVELERRDEHLSDSVFCDHAGFPQLVEKHRFSVHPNQDIFQFSGTGSYVFNTSIIQDEIKWKWHRRKLLHENRLIVKFERTLCDLTSYYQTQFVFKDL